LKTFRPEDWKQTQRFWNVIEAAEAEEEYAAEEQEEEIVITSDEEEAAAIKSEEEAAATNSEEEAAFIASLQPRRQVSPRDERGK
jgi:hypothetical protein